MSGNVVAARPSEQRLDRRLTENEIRARLRRIELVLPELRSRLSTCTLCPRNCGVQRSNGERGECGLAANLLVAAVARHLGEEPPISGTAGAINIFFSGCNLHCIHCQNWPISQQRVGRHLPPEELAVRILQRWRRGAHSLGWVTPTPQIVPALETYRLCLLKGLNVPLVHNGGGYERPDVLRLLSGIVDIWLPDAKTADPAWGRATQGVPDYPCVNRRAIAEMVRQVSKGTARAVIVRHLVLPGRLADSKALLIALLRHFGNQIYLSLMSQYFPAYRALKKAAFNRKLSPEEYADIVAFSRSIGFRRGWIQEDEVENGISLHCLS